jgi:spore coat polysaccharide biosynthesis protein SpsF
VKPKVVAIVQARMASTRLPGKVLADIEGEPMLVRVVERAGRATSVDELVVATSTDAEDKEITFLCGERGYASFRGSPLDVLDRIYQASRAHKAEVIVRLTGDCPLIEPELIDQTVSVLLEADPPLDFAANRLPDDKTFPVGTDTEVCSFSALERAWAEAEEPHQREHVMPYLYEEPRRFSTFLVRFDKDYSHHRWTVDTAEDLEFVREIYRYFDGEDSFSWRDVLGLVESEPRLAQINAHLPHKGQYDVDHRWDS